MVDRFKKILMKVIAERGPVTVFAVLKIDDITDKWSIVFSAPWVNSSNTSDIFGYLRKLVISNLTREEILSISRLSVFTNDEHLIKLILNSVKVKEGDVYLKDSRLNGFKIHEAHVFQSELGSDDVTFQDIDES